MKGGENVKKIPIAVMCICFLIASVCAYADDEKTPIPNTIASPELLGPHYLWSADPPKEKSENETNIQDRVDEESITPGTEDRIKEVSDKKRN